MQPEWHTTADGRLIGRLRGGFPESYVERVRERVHIAVGLEGGPGIAVDGPKFIDGWKHDELEELSGLLAREEEERFGVWKPELPPLTDLQRDLARLESGLPALGAALRIGLGVPEQPPEPEPLFQLGPIRVSLLAQSALAGVVDWQKVIQDHQAGAWFLSVELTDDHRFCPPLYTADIRAKASVESGSGVVASVWPIPRAPAGGEGYIGAYRAVHVVTILGDHSFIFATR